MKLISFNRISILLLPFLLLSIGCANGHCRGRTVADQTVFVYKSDGSLQCGGGQTKSVEVMAKELKAIRVLSSQNKSDGLMHTTVCGAPTGKINVYEIPAAALKEAQGYGFKEVEK